MAIRLLTEDQIDELTELATSLDRKGLREEGRRLRSVLGRLPAGNDSVPASIAAEVLSVTSQTIRNWVRAGIVAGYRDDTGHFHVKAGELEAAIRLRGALPNTPPLPVTEAEIDAEIAAFRAGKGSRQPADRP